MQPLPVSALVHLLKDMLESSEVLSDLWITGEVSNYTRSRLGHRYFTLKDDDGLMRAVLFRDDMPGETLTEGERVLVHGRVTVYPQRGDLQLVCDFVRPEGVGLQAARFEQLHARLEADGLFDPARKRPLPRFPRRIGVVTSPTGAAIQDVRNVLARRWPLASLVVSPALVQGDMASASIVEGLRSLAEDDALDLVIVARGGGGSEDLSAFNDEAVVRTIFGFPVPIVTGIGHETDVTLADLAADVRAPTPSAAAERAAPDVVEVSRALAVLDRAMASRVRARLAEEAGRIERTLSRLDRSAPKPPALAAEVARLAAQIESGMARRLASEHSRLDAAALQLETLNPRTTLARGYAIVEVLAKRRRVVQRVKDVKAGARLSVSVGDGAFWAEVS